MINSKLAWGYGEARLVSKATKEENEIVVFLSDIHAPYHDNEAINSALRLIKKIKPHRVVQIGDLFDFHSISRWNASNERLDELQNEIDIGVGILGSIRKAAPNAVLDFTMGNHDERIRKYVYEHGRALASLRSLDFSTLIDSKRFELNVHEGHGFLLRKNFLVKHGTIIRKDAGSSAKAEALAAGISGISGHTHRLGTYRQSGYNGLQWTECGTLSRLDPPYTVGRPNWQQGLAVGTFSTKTDSFVVEEVQAVDGKFWWGTKQF